MGNELFTSLTTIITAIIGVAFLSVLVSKNANTAGVTSSLFQGIGQDIGQAVSPVTGGGIGSAFNNNSLNISGNGLL